MLISETHFTSKSYNKVVGYDKISADHPSGKAHGGAAILIKHGLKFQIMDSIRENATQAATVKINACGRICNSHLSSPKICSQRSRF